MGTLLAALIALIVGAALSEASTYLRVRRERSLARLDRYEQFQAGVLAEALIAMDEAYDAASAIGLNADKHGVNKPRDQATSDEHWAYREPFVNACGLASFRLLRSAVQLPAVKSPRVEIETLARAVTEVKSEGTASEILTRFRLVDPAILAAREAAAQMLQDLYAVPAKHAKAVGPAKSSAQIEEERQS
jgi:hypothetical protein